ncbi:hypothetical protein AB1285_19170 [Microbacterium sp. NRRL B-14842]|uniref:hypothetical protein n=1 Tax=Microbacterium sp. NRRL B-14842 TaxID=3162881 RepID=UPI003D27C9CD
MTTELLPVGHPLLAGLLRSLPAGLLAVLLARRLPHGVLVGQGARARGPEHRRVLPLLFLAAERLPGGLPPPSPERSR